MIRKVSVKMSGSRVYVTEVYREMGIEVNLLKSEYLVINSTLFEVRLDKSCYVIQVMEIKYFGSMIDKEGTGSMK